MRVFSHAFPRLVIRQNFVGVGLLRPYSYPGSDTQLYVGFLYPLLSTSLL